MSHLDLDALASGNVSLGDVLAAAQASAPKAATPRDQVDTTIPYVINVEEFVRLINDDKYAYVNRQAQLILLKLCLQVQNFSLQCHQGDYGNYESEER